jgi:hypothetical protein
MSTRVEPHLAEAFRKILRPLVKVLIRAGVQFEEFARIAKGVYAESAIRDGSGMSGEATVSKLTMVTGLSRREFEAHIEAMERAVQPRPTLTAALTQLLHVWHTDPNYVGPYGVPLDLEISRSDKRNLHDLLSSVDPDLETPAVLEELLKAKLVERVGDRYLKVLTRTLLVAEPMSPEMLEYFGNAVTSLTSTLEHNMDPLAVPKRLQRAVFADDGLTDRQIMEFQRYATLKVQDLMVDLDNWLADAPGNLPDPRALKRDVGISIFQYIRSREKEAPLREMFESLRS